MSISGVIPRKRENNANLAAFTRGASLSLRRSQRAPERFQILLITAATAERLTNARRVVAREEFVRLAVRTILRQRSQSRRGNFEPQNQFYGRVRRFRFDSRAVSRRASRSKSTSSI